MGQTDLEVLHLQSSVELVGKQYCSLQPPLTRSKKGLSAMSHAGNYEQNLKKKATA
jgi:hypothetical protein